jgi:hypothetical protein
VQLTPVRLSNHAEDGCSRDVEHDLGTTPSAATDERR